MLSKYRSLALCAFFVLPALLLSACGSDVPGNSVAKVGDQSIRRSTFDHWMQIAAVSAAGQTATTGAAPKAQVPDAPSFTKCIAQKKATAGKPAKGQPEPTEAQLKGQCQQEYNQLRDQVLEFLIRGNWIEQETKKQNVKVSDKDVQKQIDAAVKQAFQNPGDFQKFLQRSGLTQADVFYQQRNQLLQQKLTEKVTKAQEHRHRRPDPAVLRQEQVEVLDAGAARPPHRPDEDARPRPTQARKALESGQSWADVTKKYSIDQASKAQGGKLAGVAKGQQEKALDDAIFKADKGKLVGPVKTQFGYYILEVSKIAQAKQQSLEQSKASIKQILTSDNQRKALDTFGKDYRNRWKAETACRKGYTTADCKNGPKTQPTTSTAAAQPQTTTGTTTQP